MLGSFMDTTADCVNHEPDGRAAAVHYPCVVLVVLGWPYVEHIIQKHIE